MINIFGLYWGLFFFSAFGELVLAGVFAEVRTFKLTKHITKPNIPEYSLPRLKLEHSKLILNIPVVLVERQRQVVHAQLRPWLCSVECHGQHHYYQT